MYYIMHEVNIGVRYRLLQHSLALYSERELMAPYTTQSLSQVSRVKGPPRVRAIKLLDLATWYPPSI